MLKIQDPIILYRDSKKRRIPAIDASAWINAGWGEDPLTKSIKPVPAKKTTKNDSNALSES
ncbi:MAG: hypothetical protein QNJ36_19795 [Calothrix sp. MO_167.B42]|nr:hypothetical protein [Calothrix sp. MO_167.B42]